MLHAVLAPPASALKPRPARPRARRVPGSPGDGAARRSTNRLAAESLVERAAHLADGDRALINAHFGLGMPLDELAALRHSTRRQLRRRLDHLRRLLADPCFLLTVQFGARLPADLAELARDYWLAGVPMRQLAQGRAATLHQIRSALANARTLLFVALSSEQGVAAEASQSAIEAVLRKSPRRLSPGGARRIGGPRWRPGGSPWRRGGSLRRFGDAVGRLTAGLRVRRPAPPPAPVPAAFAA